MLQKDQNPMRYLHRSSPADAVAEDKHADNVIEQERLHFFNIAMDNIKPEYKENCHCSW